MSKNNVILVMDWLDEYAGSEQIAKYLNEQYTFSKVYCLINIMPESSLKKIFGEKIPEIETTRLRYFKKYFRYFLPLFPYFLKDIKIKEKNSLIISVTHCVVKGIEFDSSSNHVSYLVARNLKYVWEEKDLYFVGVRKLFSFIIHYLRKFDIKMSQKPNKLISVSNFVSNWAQTKYRREVYTLNPPVNIDDFNLCEFKDDFYVSVGRLEPYKRYDILIDAFNENKKKLVIIGDGSLMKELKQKAKENIKFKGYLFPEKSKKYLEKAKGFVFCGKEDFGIALLEPQICGTPVITYRAGGALDTVVEGITGVFFDNQDSTSLISCIEKFETMKFNPHEIHNHAKKFSVESFKEKFSIFIKENVG